MNVKNNGIKWSLKAFITQIFDFFIPGIFGDLPSPESISSERAYCCRLTLPPSNVSCQYSLFLISPLGQSYCTHSTLRFEYKRHIYSIWDVRCPWTAKSICTIRAFKIFCLKYFSYIEWLNFVVDFVRIYIHACSGLN